MLHILHLNINIVLSEKTIFLYYFRICFIVITLFLLSTFIHAQRDANHLRFSTGNGKQYFSYPLKQINSSKKSGINLNLEYDKFLKRQWAVSYGIGIQNYTAYSTINGEYSFDAVDYLGNMYKYQVSCNELSTMQESWMVNFPIGVRFETKRRAFRTIYDKYIRLSVTSGIAYCLPVDSKHTHAGGTIRTSADYPQYNGEVVNVPQYWFDTFSAASNGTLLLKDSYLIFSEIGLMLDTEKKQEFYLAFYFSYGINNSIKSSSTPVINSKGEQTDLLFSDLTQKAHLMSYGFKLGVSISLEKKTRYLEARK